MYSIEQVNAILKVVIDIFRKTDPNYAQSYVQALNNPSLDPLLASAFKRKSNVPAYYDTYQVIVDFFERVRIHSELGYFPSKLFKDRSPNQTEIEYEYIRNNYKQVTLPFFIDYVSTVSRAFADPNCGVKYAQDDKFKEVGKTFQQYVEEEIQNYGSIENFVQFILPAIKAQDAMGIIVVKPNQLYTTVDDEGNPIIDETELNTPIPYYFNSKQIISSEAGKYAMVELLEKSPVSYGNKTYNMGKVYEFYDDENIWRITQIGRYIDFTFDIQVFFNHGWGKLPFTRLKGIPRIYNDEIVHMSPLLYVTDILDLVVLNASNLQVSINMCVYPYRIMYGDICEFSGKGESGSPYQCNNGQLMGSEGVSIGQCPQCGGTGLKSRISPMGVMLLRPPERDNLNDGKFDQKPMEYISPDVTTLEFLTKKIDNDYNKAQNILHLQESNSTVNAQGEIKDITKITATQVASGQQALYALVRTVSDQTFDIYHFILDCIGWQRYRENYVPVEVKYPINFELSGELDYIILLGEAGKFNLPPFIIYSIIENYLNVLYQDNENAGNAFKLIAMTDRILILNNADIEVKLATGTVEKWEEILHTSAPTFLQQLQSDFVPTGTPGGDNYIDDFFGQPIADQQKALVDMAKKKAQEVDDNASKPSNAQTLLIKKIGSKPTPPILPVPPVPPIKVPTPGVV